MTIPFSRYGLGPVRLLPVPLAEREPLRVPLRRAKRASRKLCRRIERAIAAGEHAKAKGLQRLLLKSTSGRIEAVAEVNPRLKGAQRARSNEIVAIATRASAFRASTEEAKVFAANKASGGWRPVTVFGLERAALQQLARRAIAPFHSADPRQLALTGGGHNEAARQICQWMDEGYKWFAALDIANFYASIERRSLTEIIQAPRGVIEHVICPPPDHIVRIGHIGRALAGIRLAEASQSGISQGSRSSPLVAEIIIKPMLTQLGLDVKLVNVADDFGVMARDLHAPFVDVVFFESEKGMKPTEKEVKDAAVPMEEWYGRFLTILNGHRQATVQAEPEPIPTAAGFGRRRALVAGQ